MPTEVRIAGLSEEYEDEANEMVARFLDWLKEVLVSFDEDTRAIVLDLSLFSLALQFDNEHLDGVFADIQAQRGLVN